MATRTRQAEVIIIGGGPAGLSAALYLGRARRRVVVIDAGEPRHAVSHGVHNFLTREGMSPAALRAEAWSQMAAYPSVEHIPDARVETLFRRDDRWLADAGPAGRFAAPAALVAVGVVDRHPEILGFAERWGESIHHCPYCHGWEMRDLPLAVLQHGEGAVHMGLLLRNWSSDVVVLTHGEPLDPEVHARLDAADVPVIPQRIAALEGAGSSLETIRFEDGSTLARRGLFVLQDQRQTDLVRSLGVEVDPTPHNRDGLVRVDPMQRTSRPMLWAAGDLCSRSPQVVESAAQGGRAGAAINAVLTFELAGAA